MTFPKRETVERLREQYPKGTRIVLDRCDDPYREMPEGMVGVVDFIDDTGTVFAKWPNGAGIGLVYGEDRYHKAKEG